MGRWGRGQRLMAQGDVSRDLSSASLGSSILNCMFKNNYFYYRGPRIQILANNLQTCLSMRKARHSAGKQQNRLWPNLTRLGYELKHYIFCLQLFSTSSNLVLTFQFSISQFCAKLNAVMSISHCYVSQSVLKLSVCYVIFEPNIPIHDD